MVVSKRGFVAGALVLVVGVLAVGACRRTRLSRGDAASVVVVSPRHDAPPARSVSEHEPNDSPEQAQVLAMNAEWPVMDIDGVVCVDPASKEGKDVDVFKLVVPGGPAEESSEPSVDSAPQDDPRRTARRLGVEITTEGGGNVGLQLLDGAFKVLESVVAENGEAAGMPNMAVDPGRPYFVRVRALA
jgi:hypothetical protein